MISCGFDGFVVSLLTSGVAPVSSLFELFTQVCYQTPTADWTGLNHRSHKKIMAFNSLRPQRLTPLKLSLVRVEASITSHVKRENISYTSLYVAWGVVDPD